MNDADRAARRVAEGEELLDCGHAVGRGDVVVDHGWAAWCPGCAVPVR